MKVSLRNCLNQESLDTMNFLNEVVSNYPEAVSFAPGRPTEALFNVPVSLEKVKPYVAHFAKRAGISETNFFNGLGQYGTTNGLIRELIADYLERDERIRTKTDAIIITSGCQEAMALLLMGLFEPGKDVLLVSDPSYIGITGLAAILGVSVWPVPTSDRGLEPMELERAIEAVRARNLNPKAVYDIPDFNNPLGTSMPLENRHRILEIARAQKILIFEDNPYGMFAYDGPPAPTLKSLDRHGVVIYLGTVSKTLFPGLRLGYLVAEQEAFFPSTTKRLMLTKELSKVKSFLSVNTSPILQAIVGGILLEENGTLNRLLEPKIAFYKANRDHMSTCLENELRETRIDDQLVSCNRPGGGFFLTIRLPFEFDDVCLRVCAEEYQVICCPMTFFSLTPGREKEIRLSFSYVSHQQIRTGVSNLVRFIRTKI